MNSKTKKIKEVLTERRAEVKIISNAGKNRIAINLISLSFEIESHDSSLKEVFALADLIARNLGKEHGIDGATWNERTQRAGIAWNQKRKLRKRLIR